MTSESRITRHSVELTDYGDEDIPVGMRLGTYLLHTPKWRAAFLVRLTEVGYVGLIEAATRIYDLLNEPKEVRCAFIAQRAGASGSGKHAIYCALHNFLDEFLTMPVLSLAPSGESLEQWHARVMSGWQTEHEREEAVVKEFAMILDGRQPCRVEPELF